VQGTEGAPSLYIPHLQRCSLSTSLLSSIFPLMALTHFADLAMVFCRCSIYSMEVGRCCWLLIGESVGEDFVVCCTVKEQKQDDKEERRR
jgi:hypothetical protein